MLFTIIYLTFFDSINKIIVKYVISSVIIRKTSHMFDSRNEQLTTKIRQQFRILKQKISASNTQTAYPGT